MILTILAALCVLIYLLTTLQIGDIIFPILRVNKLTLSP